MGIGSFGVVFGLDEIAGVIHAGRDRKARLPCPGQNVGDHVGVRPIQNKPFAEPIVEQVQTGPHALASAEQVFKVVSPLVDEGVGVCELIDELGSLLRIAAKEKLFQVGGGGDAAGGIKPSAAGELFVGSEGGVGDAVFLHAAENVLVDEITADDGGARAGLSGGQFGGEGGGGFRFLDGRFIERSVRLFEFRRLGEEEDREEDNQTFHFAFLNI